jgi:hypothetical protein
MARRILFENAVGLEVFSERAYLNMDFAHHRIDSLLAHLGQPDESGFVVDVGTFQVLRQGTEGAGRKAAGAIAIAVPWAGRLHLAFAARQAAEGAAHPREPGIVHGVGPFW